MNFQHKYILIESFTKKNLHVYLSKTLYTYHLSIKHFPSSKLKQTLYQQIEDNNRENDVELECVIINIVIFANIIIGTTDDTYIFG